MDEQSTVVKLFLKTRICVAVPLNISHAVTHLFIALAHTSPLEVQACIHDFPTDISTLINIHGHASDYHQKPNHFHNFPTMVMVASTWQLLKSKILEANSSSILHLIFPLRPCQFSLKINPDLGSLSQPSQLQPWSKAPSCLPTSYKLLQQPLHFLLCLPSLILNETGRMSLLELASDRVTKTFDYLFSLRVKVKSLCIGL